MFSPLTNRLALEISVVRSTVATHDLVRNAVAKQRDLATAGGVTLDELAPIVGLAPSAIDWRIFDHSAAYTRLYVSYERFVFDLIDHWLQLLPKLYEGYSELPEAVQANHRVGVAEILGKLGGDRYEHLSERDVLKGISDGHRGVSYTLLPDAFKTDERNLWKDTIQKIFKKCGIDNIWNWIEGHKEMQSFLANVRGDASTAESELRSFVFARNESSHDVPDNIMSLDELENISEFIVILCRVLAEAVHRQFILRKLEMGQAMIMGDVIHQFSNQVLGVRVASGSLKVGDELIVLHDSSCIATKIESIQIEHKPYSIVSIWGSTDVGLKFTKPGRMQAQIVRVTSRK